MYSCCGCLRPPWGGTLATVPSRILSRACCTPSPDTSRVMLGFSDLRAIFPITYWSSTSLISAGVGTCVMASPTSRSSSSARISLHRAMHSLQIYTDGPEMNFRTESLDLPQKEQRRCLSCDIVFLVWEGAANSASDHFFAFPSSLISSKFEMT